MKNQKKNGRGGGVGSGGRVGGGQGGCERRIEVVMEIQKKKGMRVGEVSGLMCTED